MAAAGGSLEEIERQIMAGKPGTLSAAAAFGNGDVDWDAGGGVDGAIDGPVSLAPHAEG
jgi:hypothetical protein